MNWAAMFWIMVFVGGFCLLLALGDLVTDILYEIFPPYRNWFDEHNEEEIL